MKLVKAFLMTGIAAVVLLGTSIFAAADETSAETVKAETQHFSDVDDLIGNPKYKIMDEDGLITVEAPNSTWKCVPTETACAGFSDGTCAVLMSHYTPDTNILAARPSKHCPYVYQDVITTPDIIVTITGFAASEEDLLDVMEIVKSAELDLKKLQNKKDEKPHEIDPDVFSVEAVKKTMYCATSCLTVRASGTTESEALGSFSYNEAVSVTGIVKKNGKDAGWTQVDYHGKTGYCASTYLSDKSLEAQKTGNSMLLYYENSNAVDIYEYSDGTWRDLEGRYYSRTSASTWSNGEGSVLYIYEPGIRQPDSNEGESWTVYVESNYLALRSYPNSSENVEIGQLYPGMEVTVINKYDPTYWYVHSYDLGMDGFVNSGFLTK